MLISKEKIISTVVNTLPENTVIIDKKTGKVSRGKINIDRQTIINSGHILANILLDYAKSGGDMGKLSPSAVFARKGDSTL